MPVVRTTRNIGRHKGRRYRRRAPLLLDHRAIELPDDSPPTVELLGAVAERILRRQLRVDLDPPPGVILAPSFLPTSTGLRDSSLGLSWTVPKSRSLSISLQYP